jgi:hypothetical protein
MEVPTLALYCIVYHLKQFALSHFRVPMLKIAKLVYPYIHDHDSDISAQQALGFSSLCGCGNCFTDAEYYFSLRSKVDRMLERQ